MSAAIPILHPSSQTPSAPGVGSAGTSRDYMRADAVIPRDDSKADVGVSSITIDAGMTVSMDGKAAGAAGLVGFVAEHHSDVSTARPVYDFVRSRGTQASPTAVLNADRLGYLAWWAYAPTGGYQPVIYESVRVSGVPSGSLVPGAKDWNVNGVVSMSVDMAGPIWPLLKNASGLKTDSTGHPVALPGLPGPSIESAFGFDEAIVESIGTNWSRVYALAFGGEFTRIIPLEGGIVLAGGSNNTAAIARSTDYGRTWTLQNSFLVSAVAEYEFGGMAYLGGGIVLAGSATDLGNPTNHPGGRIWRSTDYGLTWASSTLLDTATQSICAISNLGGGIVVAFTGSGHVLRSTDYGATWTDQGQILSSRSFVDSTYIGNGVVIAGGVPANIIRSLDYGLTWTRVAPYINGNIGRLCHLDANTGIALATDTGGHIYRSTDYGATWTDLGQQGGDSYSVYSLAYCGGGIVLGGKSTTGHVLRSLDYGLTWTDIGVKDSGEDLECMVHIGNGVCLFGTDASGHIKRSIPTVELPQAGLHHICFCISGDAKIGDLPWKIPMPCHGIVLAARAEAGTVPVGADLVLALENSGSEITTVPNRLQIADGATTGTTVAFSANTFAAGDYFSGGVVSVGSSVAGANVMVILDIVYTS